MVSPGGNTPSPARRWRVGSLLSCFIGLAVCLSFLAGCGGGFRGAMAPPHSPPPDFSACLDDESDESISAELSAKRLEELYAKSGIRGGDAGLEEELKKWEHQSGFDLPIQMNKQVKAYLVYFSTERKEVIRRYLSRSTRYLPMIKNIFREYGLPGDLAYLAMIESGFNNQAHSHASAVGMWQFIKGTGLRYGLAINQYVDERRDPEKATRAAARYLLDLYQQFGSWYLAAAGYNCGEGRVQRELHKSNHKNFWELSANRCLPSETKNYVPQLIAATIIAKNPGKFGFTHVAYQGPLKREKVPVTESVSLGAVAAAVNVPSAEIQALNPELTRGVTPPGSGSYTLYLPPSTRELFARNIAQTRAGHPAVAAMPMGGAAGSGRSMAPSADPPVSQASVLGASSQQSRTAAKPAKKRTTQVADARSRKANVRSAPQGTAAVHVASLFGAPGVAAGKGAAGKQKSAAASTAKAKEKRNPHLATGKGKKSSSAPQAKKTAARKSKVQAAKKHDAADSHKDKSSRAKKAKPKALLMSQAR